MAYNHTTGKVEIRKRTQSGLMLHEFDNSTPIDDVLQVFARL